MRLGDRARIHAFGLALAAACCGSPGREMVAWPASAACLPAVPPPPVSDGQPFEAVTLLLAADEQCLHLCEDRLCPEQERLAGYVTVRNHQEARTAVAFVDLHLVESRRPDGLGVVSSSSHFFPTVERIGACDLADFVILGPGQTAVRPVFEADLVWSWPEQIQVGWHGWRAEATLADPRQVFSPSDCDDGIRWPSLNWPAMAGGSGGSSPSPGFDPNDAPTLAAVATSLLGVEAPCCPGTQTVRSNEVFMWVAPGAPSPAATPDSCDKLRLGVPGEAALVVVDDDLGSPIVRDLARIVVSFERCAEQGSAVVEAAPGASLVLLFESMSDPGIVCARETPAAPGSAFLGEAHDLFYLQLVAPGEQRHLPRLNADSTARFRTDRHGCALPGWFAVEAVLFGVQSPVVRAILPPSARERLASVPGAMAYPTGSSPAAALVAEAETDAALHALFGAPFWTDAGVDSPAVLRSDRRVICLRRPGDVCPAPPSPGSVD